MWYTTGSTAVVPGGVQIWCRSLLFPDSEFCWPSPGPGGLAQPLYSDFGTGASAFGTGSTSRNGVRISGLVGNASV